MMEPQPELGSGSGFALLGTWIRWSEPQFSRLSIGIIITRLLGEGKGVCGAHMIPGPKQGCHYCPYVRSHHFFTIIFFNFLFIDF